MNHPTFRILAIARLALHLKSIRNPHEHFLIDLPVKESRRDVHCLKFQVLDRRQGNYRSDGRKTCRQGEYFAVVYAWHLAESLRDQSSLVLVDETLQRSLDLEDPSAPNRPLPRWQLRELPRPILHMRLDLLQRRFHPLIRILTTQRIPQGTWFQFSRRAEYAFNCIKQRNAHVRRD